MTTTPSPVLSSLSVYDKYAANTTRNYGELLDILEGQNLDGDGVANDGDDDGGDMLGLCHLVTFLPFTEQGKANLFAYEAAAGVALAIQHLNVGDGTLIREVEGLNDRCNIRFTTEFANSQYEAGPALDEMIRLTHPGRFNDGRQMPCAILGPFRSVVAGPTSLVSGLRGYPQISGAATSADLDDKNLYPKFARTIPSVVGAAKPIVLYVRRHLLLEYLAVINVDDSFGNSYARALKDAASIHTPDLVIRQILVDVEDERSIARAIQALKETKLQFIFLIASTQKTHDAVMREAVRMGVAGTGVHNWVFADPFLFTINGRLFEPNSLLQKAYTGVGMFKASATASPKYVDFSNEIRQVNNPADFIYLSTMLPEFNQTSFYRQGTFLNPKSNDFTLFFYEAAVLLGLSACDAVADGSPGGNLTLTGDALYDHMVNFPMLDGVTGELKLDPSTGSRIPDSTYYEVMNFVPEEVVDPNSGETTVKFNEVTTDLYHNDKWVNKESFIFNDGTTNLPYGIPQPSPDQNYLNPGVRIVVLIMCGVTILLAAAFGFWTYRNRQERVVMASQPFFLYLICGGCIILASTIIPLSIDSRNTPIEGCSIACTACMWLFFVGFAIIFSGLFAKTHRINTIMKNAKMFKRIKVTVRDTLKPVIVLVALNIIILSLMTFLNSPDYVIYILFTDEFGQPVQTFGHCDFQGTMWLIGALCLLNFAILLLALFEAWQARNLSTEFAESQYIFRALLCIFMVACIGVPVLIIAYDNPDASLFVSSGMIFISTCAILMLIFLPKIQHERGRLANPSRRNVVKISGINPSNNSTGSSGGFVVSPSLLETLEPSWFEGEEATDDGERILTVKTQKELAEENALLKKLLKREREAKGKEKMHHDKGNTAEVTPDTRMETFASEQTAAFNDHDKSSSGAKNTGAMQDMMDADDDADECGCAEAEAESYRT